MDVEEIVNHIFGSEFDTTKFCEIDSSSAASQSKKSKCLESVRNWVGRVMHQLDAPEHKDGYPEDMREGRIGPASVRFDIKFTHCTIRANACVFKGKWQYEVQLGSKGVMQIGWATSDCKFSQETGVGDTVHSYAYDGNRVRKWNVATHQYGESWLSGDIIGCTIDLDRGVIEFYRNGKSMGEAFDNIQLGPGMAYFPAVSLAFTENLVANFGSTPMKYPVTGYEPIQEAPFHDVAKTQKLCSWVSKLLMLFDRKYEVLGPEVSQSNEPMSNQALLMGLAKNILDPLGPLFLSPYIIESCLVPFLENLCNLSPSSERNKSKAPMGKKRRLLLFLDMIWAFFEEHELKKCMECVVTCLLTVFRQVSYFLDYPNQKRSLLLLTYLVQHSRTRQYLLEHILFDKVRFANFVHVKPLDEAGLAEVVSQPWWESNISDEKLEENKTAYLSACAKIKESFASIEALQVDLLKTLMDNSDGTPTQPSSRKIFLRKFRNFLQENLLSSRTLPLLQTPLPITLCCFHRLLVTFRALWEREVGEYPIVIPTRTFYDGSINYYNIDRLGGVLSHLNKTLKDDLIKTLGSDHSVIRNIESSHSQTREIGESSTFISAPSVSVGTQFTDGQANIMIPVLARMISQHQPTSGSMLVERISITHSDEKIKTGAMDPASSLIELLDGLILFYHVAAHKQLAKVSTLRDNMAEYVRALNDVNLRLKTYKHPPPNAAPEADSLDIIAELEQTCLVFETKLSEQSRHMAWVRAVVYSTDKQSHLAWLLRVVLQTVKLASQDGQLFAFVPDFYLDSLIEICSALRNYLHPTSAFENIEGYEDLLIEVSEFLCDHFSDPRIVHANSKDTLIQALANFVCSSNTLIALEKVPYASRMHMVRALLRPYENRAWAQSNWVLVRIWQGCGFAFRYHKSPHLLRKLGPKLLQVDSSFINQSMKPCPSTLFQGHVKEVMISDEALTTSFLNSLLNQLNWAFSEFIGMLQEIQNVSSPLLRVLEMVASIAPEIFTDSSRSSSELLLGRLCQ
ncbi:hypothetical protein L9F63_021458, partial [Diploptera punctata]